MEVREPKTPALGHALDFGPDFYTTLFRGQAEGFAREVVFCKTGADDYIRRSFGALHTMGGRYVMDDIDGFVQGRLQ